MKIVAGLGCLEDFDTLAEAGADELFVGFVPIEYYEKYGNILPANRREVYFYHVQINSYEDMVILHDMAMEKGIPVSVTFNSLYYTDEQMADIYQIMQKLKTIGFERFIVADIGFLHYLREKQFHAEIELSGEIGELNSILAMSLMKEYGETPGVKRLIFQRKTQIEQMNEVIKKVPMMESEAFLMNENCQFSGGYCNSMHCDEMVHMCLVPYLCKSFDGKPAEYPKKEYEELPESVPGVSGCGLCALWKLVHAGITHGKIVGRGLSAEEVVTDIRAVKKALQILESSKNEEEYVSEMKKQIFLDACSANCYYPE